MVWGGLMAVCGLVEVWGVLGWFGVFQWTATVGEFVDDQFTYWGV